MPPGAPFLPYGRQLIEADDVAAVVAALQDELIAHGPRVTAFERAFAEASGAAEAVACSSGTAALHLALAALGTGAGDVCVVPAITFLSTATAALHCGEVRFADVDPETGLMTAETLSQALAAAPQVSVVLPVHLGGRFCDMAAIEPVARQAGCAIVEDACHAVGGVDAEGRAAGECARSDAATFSFHPVKTLAAGEGGMVACKDPARAERMRRLRNHGVTRDPALMGPAFERDALGQPEPWAYEQLEVGFNYRMNELEAALGFSQLAKLPRFAARRRALAARYDAALAPLAPWVRPVGTPAGQDPALHLYQVLIDFNAFGRSRGELMRELSERGIGTQVHYIPLPLQPPLRRYAGGRSFPGAGAFYERVLALPLFPAMQDADVGRVTDALAALIV